MLLFLVLPQGIPYWRHSADATMTAGLHSCHLQEETLIRIEVSSHKRENVESLLGFRSTAYGQDMWDQGWFGLSPDDRPNHYPRRSRRSVKSKGTLTRMAPVWAKAEVSRTTAANATETTNLVFFITPPGAVLRKFSYCRDSAAGAGNLQCTGHDSGVDRELSRGDSRVNSR
jgi:hypothetical protein